MNKTVAINIKEIVHQDFDEWKFNDNHNRVKIKSLCKDGTRAYVSNITADIHYYKLYASINLSIISNELMLIRSKLVKQINQNIGQYFTTKNIIC